MCFVITNLAVFSFIAPITCFHLFATKLGYFELKLAKMVRLGKMRKLDELGANKVDWRSMETASSTISGKVFLTANPTLYFLQSLKLLPCRKKVQSFSFNDPGSARHVSCRDGNVCLRLSSSVKNYCGLIASLMF